MNKLELLAPAQNYECAISAINCGADAVYIGGYSFGARKKAGNSLDDIERIIKYAHLFNVRVYVTVNTILNDSELCECEKFIWDLYKIKVDGIIIQDFGILNLNLPPLAIHASTQCDNRDIEKIKFLEKVGFRRVILARELSLDKIEKINDEVNIELEHFIYGALCVSYSGQCYMSEFIGGRSANKGDCAQACRMKYDLVDKTGKTILKDKYLLSLKDNNLSSHLNKLIKAGISSFKIEGRLKDSNYVKNTVLFYHKLLGEYQRQGMGVVFSDFEPNPDKTFNRGFCDDYLFNKKDNIYNFSTPKSMGEYIGEVLSQKGDTLTLKTNKKLHTQDGLCFIVGSELEGCFVNKVEVVKSGVKILLNKKVNLKIGDKIYRNIDYEFNKILENSNTKRKLGVEFVIKENGIMVVDERRNKEFYEFIDIEAAKNQEKMKENFEKSLGKTGDTPFFTEKVKFEAENLPFIPISKLNEIRRDLLSQLEENILSKYKTKKPSKIDISKYPTDCGDYRLNVHNKKAEEFYQMCDCKIQERSFESSKRKDKQYELMRTKHCLKRASLGCKTDEELFLVDKKGVKYPLKFDCKNCEMIVLSP